MTSLRGTKWSGSHGGKTEGGEEYYSGRVIKNRAFIRGGQQCLMC